MADFLVLAPPVATPSEPPSGAFMLAAGLAARGYDAALVDLSLGFYRRLLRAGADGRPAPHAVARAVGYLDGARGPYQAAEHRTHAGRVHQHLREHARRWSGWSLSLMDVVPPGGSWDPAPLAADLAAGGHPFAGLWEDLVDPVLLAERPRRVLVSLAYLSQLPATLDLLRHLRARGVEPIVGGSLGNSLAATGGGFEALVAAIPGLRTGDGMDLISRGAPRERLLDRLAWPRLVGESRYLSSRPIIPLSLSAGCYWSKCLFCPDRELPFSPVRAQVLGDFLATLPPHIAAARPVVHLLDSAIPPAQLRRFLPLATSAGVDFYGFARPTARLLRDDLLPQAADAGCLMLQLGVEGGEGALLDRFQKGLDPDEAARVLDVAAEHGIRTYVYLLFGLPGETPADREATRRLLVDHAHAVDFLNLSVFNLPLRCDLTARPEDFGITLEPLPSDAAIQLYRPFSVGGIIPRVQVRPFLRALRADPAVRPAVLRTPRWLRAAHLALMDVPGRRPAGA